MNTDTLQLIGLPKNEAKIYESLLKLGPANVTVISNTAKINRRNVYDSIRNLTKRKLVFSVHGEREILYKAEDPKKLREILESQKNDISQVLPDLKSVYQEHIPQEQAFISQGLEGIKNYWRYVVSQNQTAYFVAGKGLWYDPRLEKERVDFFKRCKQRGIVIKGIFDYEVIQKGKDVYECHDPKVTRFFPAKYSTKTTFDICGNRIVMCPTIKFKGAEDTVFFTIISQALVDSYRTWFEFLWQKAKSLI